MDISDVPEDDAVFTNARCCELNGEWRRRSNAPSTPFMGVLISWLIVARNWDFARFAASADSFAAFNETAAASASRLCRIALIVVCANSREARYIVTPNIAIKAANGSAEE